MEYRQLGGSGLRVPVLSFGTATFGGGNDFFKAWGSTQIDEATQLIHLCLDSGITMFDTADCYSQGLSEQILGTALKGVRNEVLISSKGTFAMGTDVNGYGSSRYHLIEACENSLRRLQTDHIDIYYMHGFDANTPVQETLRALETLIQSGKVRYIACSNFSGWHLMKSLGISEKYGLSPYVAHQVSYSLLNRDYECELMALAEDQKVGAVIWSGLAEGRLSGKYRRDKPEPVNTRVAIGGEQSISYTKEKLYDITDVLDSIAKEAEKTVTQVNYNWLLQRPTVSNIVVGARNVEQLKENLGTIGWKLTQEQIKRLDEVSAMPLPYPYWHQQNQSPKLNSRPKLYQPTESNLLE